MNSHTPSLNLFALSVIVFAIGAWAQSSSCDVAGSWERLVEAKGGRKRLQGLRTIVIERFDRQGFLMPEMQLRTAAYLLEEYSWSWNRAWTSKLGAVVSRRNWTNGVIEIAFETSPAVMKESRATGGRSVEPLIPLFIEPRGFSPRPRSCVGSLNTITIVADSDDTTFEFFLDSKTFLPARVVERRPFGTTTYVFKNYRDIEGVIVPETITTTEHPNTSSTNRVTLHLNVEIDPDLFARPLNPFKGPNQWKVKPKATERESK